MRYSRTQARRLIKWSLLLLGGLACGAFLFIWSGLYSVAASRGHWAAMEWLLTFAMRNSVKTHAYGIVPPPLNDDDLVTLGAAHFHSGCSSCHGAPGTPLDPIAQAMLPPPPDLATSMRQWRDRELFWIVKNGIKYTGMPAWSAQQREDEVWALVAFLRRLPELDAQSYRRLALRTIEVPQQTGRDIAMNDANLVLAGTCVRCHGDERHAPASRLVPILHGQPAEYLTLALRAYASGQRPSGIMQPIAAERSEADLAKVAQYYASLSPPAPAKNIPPAAIARGRILAEQGDADARIPPCSGCHSAEAREAYPRLAGQNRRYTVNRLLLWKNGLPPNTAGETIMVPVARLLDDRQIEDVAAYYASLTPARRPAPAQ